MTLGTPPTVGGGDGFVGTDLGTDPSVKSSYTMTLTAGTARGGWTGLVQRRRRGRQRRDLLRGRGPDIGWWRALLRDQPGWHHLHLHRGRRRDAERRTGRLQPRSSNTSETTPGTPRVGTTTTRCPPDAGIPFSCTGCYTLGSVLVLATPSGLVEGCCTPQETAMILDLRTITGSRGRVQRDFSGASFSRGEDGQYRVADRATLDLDVRKDGGKFQVVGRLDATLELGCCRCLDSFPLVVGVHLDLLYLPVSDSTGDAEVQIEESDLHTAFYRDDQIDLGQLIRRAVSPGVADEAALSERLPRALRGVWWQPEHDCV